MKKSSITYAVLLSIINVAVILAFYSMGGAISQINEMNAIDSNWVRGICVWLSVVAALLFEIIRKRLLLVFPKKFILEDMCSRYGREADVIRQ